MYVVVVAMRHNLAISCVPHIVSCVPHIENEGHIDYTGLPTRLRLYAIDTWMWYHI